MEERDGSQFRFNKGGGRVFKRWGELRKIAEDKAGGLGGSASVTRSSVFANW